MPPCLSRRRLQGVDGCEQGITGFVPVLATARLQPSMSRCPRRVFLPCLFPSHSLSAPIRGPIVFSSGVCRVVQEPWWPGQSAAQPDRMPRLKTAVGAEGKVLTADCLFFRSAPRHAGTAVARTKRRAARPDASVENSGWCRGESSNRGWARMGTDKEEESDRAETAQQALSGVASLLTIARGHRQSPVAHAECYCRALSPPIPNLRPSVPIRGSIVFPSGVRRVVQEPR